LFGTKVGPGFSEEDKIWKVLTALGNIALACSYATVVYDIMVKARTLLSKVTLYYKSEIDLLCSYGTVVH